MRPVTHYRDLTFRYLRQQKKRSLLTILGIVLSVALMFTSSVMGETLKQQFIQSIKDQQGNYHVAYQGVTDDQLLKLQANAKIESVGVKIDIGSYRNPKGVALNVIGADEGFLDILGFKLSAGRLPRAPGEIALEKWYIESMPNAPRIGDRIPLQLSDAEGRKSISAEPVLTGIFQNKTVTQLGGLSYGILTPDAAKELTGPANVKLDAGVRFKPHIALQSAIRETTEAIGAADKDAQPNTALLTALGQSKNRSNNEALTIAQGIIVGIILIATLAVIYNAFHISVLERIRQFGVLRSIGMTPRQIRAIVFGEASVLAAVGIPLGLLVGWTAIKAVLAVFSRIDKTNFFSGLHMEAPWYVTVGTILLTLAAVYVSAWGPALSAGRVSPLTAIMHSNRFDKDKATRRKRRLVTAMLGITGKMAFDNMRRNRRRYRITLFSMCIGIVLFVFFSSFLSFVQLSQSRLFAKDYAVDQGYKSETPQFTTADYEEIARMPGVKTVYRVMMDRMQISFPENKLTDKFKQGYGLDESKSPTFGMQVNLWGYRAEDLQLSRPRLIQGSMDAAAMERENGVVLSQRSYGPNGVTAVSQYKVGDTIELSAASAAPGQQRSITLTVVGLLDKMPISYSGGSEQYTVITTETVFARITGIGDRFNRFDIVVDRHADQSAIKDRLQQLASRVDTARVLDFAESADRSATLIIGIMLYGLVAVISVISAINIINTISTNLILRTREFGTLRAVGMTMGQMRRMIVYESVWYGALATLIGGTAGALLSRWLYTMMNRVQDLPYHFPWAAIFGSGLAAVLIGLFASRVPLRRVARMDVVQAIRAEE